MAKKYLFASCRGEDFEVEGDTPEDAWSRLVGREFGNGTLRRAFDTARNEFAIKSQGFKKMGEVAYKEI